MQYGLLEQIDSINVDTVEKNLHQSSVVGSFKLFYVIKLFPPYVRNFKNQRS